MGITSKIKKLKRMAEKAGKKYREISKKYREINEKLAKVNVGRKLTKEEVAEITNPSRNKKYKEFLEI